MTFWWTILREKERETEREIEKRQRERERERETEIISQYHNDNFSSIVHVQPYSMDK